MSRQDAPNFQLSRREWMAFAALASSTALPLLSTGCAQTPKRDAYRSEAADVVGSFEAWSEAFAADWVGLSAERATFTQYFKGAEQAAFERQLSPQTPERRQRQVSLARDGLATLARFEAAGQKPALSTTQRIAAATMRWSLQRTVAAEPFEHHGFVFNQLNGPQVSLISFMSEAHPMRNAEDAAAFVARLEQVPARMDEAIARARVSEARGLLPPRFILDKVRTQVEDFLKPTAANNLLVQAFANRSALITTLPAAERTKLLNDTTALVQEQIRPAWQRVLALVNDLLPRTGAAAGLWRLPDGEAAYAQALATYTTTTLDANQIHDIGLREVARIEAEMDRVLVSLGRRQGTVQVRMEALRAELQPPASPDPRPALIDKFGEYVRDAQRRSQALFNLQPKAPIEVRREPALTEKTAAAHYSAPAPDGSRPGVFWAPLPGPTFNMAGMRTLAIHEAVPGHHFQLALQQEQLDLPRWRQRRIFGGGSAHSEGWALYAERLAIDNGWYTGDATALLGALDAQLFRARRLVVDTGLHVKRWTREQAINYGINGQEVDRYVSNPGQACAYMIGMLRLLDLREEARNTMGENFTLKGYHDVVLKTGSVPLDVLGEVVRQWAAASPKPAAPKLEDKPVPKPSKPAPNKSL
jgi:uncharacterized protein (DUF885 family)